MERISINAEQEIKTLLVNWWMAVSAQLGAATGASVQIGQAPVDMLFASEIGQRLTRIAATAEAIEAAEARQEAYAWSAEQAGQILQDCEMVETWLNQGAVSHKTPDAFWTTPVGFMILRARVWANQDELITLSTAAQISGMSLSVLSQRMTRGQLQGYRDPKEKNPRRARRIRLSNLHALLNENQHHLLFPTPSFLPAQPQRSPTPISPHSM